MARAKKHTNQRRGQGSRTRLPNYRLKALIEEAIVDAYGESEQRLGFLTMLEEHLSVPFMTEILGVAVRVDRVHLNNAEEIVAICRRGPHRQSIPILARISDLSVLPYPTISGRTLIFRVPTQCNGATEGDTLWVNYSTSRFRSRSTAF
jgi:hypothetical protein